MKENVFISEFNRQVENLLQKNYPQTANQDKNSFLNLIQSLQSALKHTELPDVDIEQGTLPFVIVVTHTRISSEAMMNLVEKDGKKGVTQLYPHTSENFKTIEEVELPRQDAYLLINIDRGKQTLNIRPYDAYITIKKQGRSPLTIDEGIALVTHYPEFLIKNNCFSLLASRTGTDKRVPAIWINGKKEPNLGWCWDGNPHTWLGSASCSRRVV